MRKFSRFMRKDALAKLGRKIPKGSKNWPPAVLSNKSGLIRNGRNTISLILPVENAELQIQSTTGTESREDAEMLPGSTVIVLERTGYETVPRGIEFGMLRFVSSPLEAKEPAEH